MRLIAHRVFRDGARLDACDTHRFGAYDGVELDLRLNRQGRLVVEHAPVFRARLRRAEPCENGFEDALTLLASAPTPPQTLFLDVKCQAAASAAARRVAESPPCRDIVFTCWRADDAAAVRAILPDARIFFCVAPIVARRAPRGRLENLYLTNSFPFFWAAERFEPDPAKSNRHNINIRLISSRRGEGGLPEGVDGVCVHRLFWRPTLAALAAAQGLEAAVYGLASRAQAIAQAAVGPVAYAIIGERRDALRASARRSLRRSA